jgi:hypothetical protein
MTALFGAVMHEGILQLAGTWSSPRTGKLLYDMVRNKAWKE